MKCRLKILVFVLCFGLWTCPSWAQPPQALSWLDCVAEAKKNNPDLVSAQAKLAQAQAQKNISRSGLLPQISANASVDASKVSKSSRTDKYAYGASAQQLVFDGFKKVYDVSSSQENIKAARYNYDVVSSNVRLNLRTAFVGVLNAQAGLEVAQDIAVRRKQELDSVNLRYQGGSENKGSLMKSQANWAQAQYQIAQARRSVELDQRQLAKAIGWENFVAVTVKGEFTVQEADRTQPQFEQMVDQVPFLQQLAAQKDAARFGVKSAAANFFPTIYASADIGKSDSSWPPGKTSWGAGLSLSVPLFEGGLQQAQLAQAHAALTQSQADERSGRDSVLYTLASTWTQLQNSIDNVGVQKQFLDAAQERAKIAEAEYGSGLVTFNNWIIIEDDLVSLESSFLGVKTNALIAEANWAQAKGEILDE